MANFNPVFDTPVPDYLKLSKSIQQPYSPAEGDKSVGILLKTGGEVLDEGVKLADSTIKDSIKNDLEDTIRTRRDKFIGQLDDLLGGRGNNPASASTSDPMNARAEDTGTGDLMPATGPEAPSGVTRSLDTVQRLSDAREQAGKFRTTSFDADIDRELKRVRSQWPGYKDYIDQEASKIVGYNVANKLVSDKVAQLNELATQSRAEKDKIENFIRSHSEVPGFAEVATNFHNGQITDADVYKWAGTYDAAKANLTNKKLAYEAASSDQNLSRLKAGEVGESIVSHYATAAYTYNRLANGQDPLQTAQEMHDKLIEIGTDPSKYPGDAAMVELQNKYEMARADATSKIQQAVFTPNPKTGRALADDWGVDNANQFIKKTIDGTFGTTSKLFSGKDFALAESNQRRTAAITQDANMALLHSDIGREAAMSKAVAQDPALSAVVTQKLMTAKDFMPRLNNFTESKVMGAVTQTNNSIGMKPTLKQDITDTKGADGSDAEKGIAVKTFADVYKVITDKKTSDRSKTNAANYLFDQSNKGFLQEIAKEGIDANGVPTKGQIDVFEQVTNTHLSDEMWRLAERTGNKDIWNKYTKLAQNEFGVKMVTDIQNLNNLQDSSSLYGAQWHYAYDDEAKQFYPLHEDGSHLSRAEQSWFNPAWRTTDAINRGLANIRHMAEVAKLPKDTVDAYVFQTLEQAGWSPTKDVDGVPAKIMNALLTSKGLPESDTNAPKVAHPKTPDTSLIPDKVKDFLKKALTDPGAIQENQNGP
jgi:hypothetical protein